MIINKANYIVFHPDKQREKTQVRATALVNGNTKKNWTGSIWVDKIGDGNEDPFVFNDPWLYSYCHASQLRRDFKNEAYLQAGSNIIFASGQQANIGILTIDTFFSIGEVQKWIQKPSLQLPAKYHYLLKIQESPLWLRHFCFPFRGHHTSVSHTYEAELWEENKSDFSYLPLNDNGERISIPFTNFPSSLQNKLLKKVKGKYPVLLSDSELQIIRNYIDTIATIKVLKNIVCLKNIIFSKEKKC